MSITLTIPRAPMSLNRIVGHWSKRAREKKLWKDDMYAAACSLHPAFSWGELRMPCVDKSKVRVEIEIHHSRDFDRVNLYGSVKPIEDAIVSLGWAYDDRDAFMDTKVSQVKSKRTEQKTIIRISKA